jgi:DnaJ-class molecular chaperone
MEHYQTLGVAKNASPDEIKKAYRKLASQHHPDRGGDTATFQKIQIAYDTISDPDKRQQYDNPMQGNPFGGFGGFSAGTVHEFNINDLFGQMFRHHQPQHNQRNNVLRTTYWVTLDQVYNGGEEVLNLQTHIGTHTVRINVPKGLPDGGQVRYDTVIADHSLIVEFRIHNHLKFERKMNDLACNHSISVLDLITGTTFEFTTMSGKTLEVTVPPKTQPFMSLKLNGHGMPIHNTNSFGDQIILLKAFIPDIIDTRITDSILLSRTK